MQLNTGSKEHFITVPFEHSWIFASGNRAFSVVNLVKAALNINLNFINQSKLANTTDTDMLRLHTLIKAFPYYYDSNCDMLKYLNMQTLDSFKKAMDRYVEYAEFLSESTLYEIKDLKPSFSSLKCGSPTHLKERYLNNLNKTELQCENTLCTDNIKCYCIETPYNNTLRINCTCQLFMTIFLNWNYI